MPFINRFNDIEQGCIVITGNTLGLSRQRGTQNPGNDNAINQFITTNTSLTTPSQWAAIVNLANSENMTFNWQNNSSSAYLNMLTGYEVLYAELVWGGMSISDSSGGRPAIDVSGSIDNAVTFTTPLETVQITPDPSTAKTASLSGTGTFYIRSQNVTQYVSKPGAGIGFYTTGAVPSAINLNEATTVNHAGWTLIVAYKNTALPYRNMTIFIGEEFISSGNPSNVTISGFQTPIVGDVTARILVSAQEGDANLIGDQMYFGTSANPSTALSGPNNPQGNFFCSQINIGDPNNANVGTIDTTGTFGSRNSNANTGTVITAGRQGWDVTNVDGSSVMQNNKSTAYIRLTSSGDVYLVNTLGVQIDTVFVSGTKTVDKTSANVADTLTYNVVLKNEGGSSVSNVVFNDPAPSGTTYVNNSVIITGAAATGNPVTGITIPTLTAGQTVNIQWQVTINANIAATQINNTGIIVIDGSVTENTNQVTTNLINADLKIEKTASPNSFIPGQYAYYTITVTNNSAVYPSQNVFVNDAVPSSIASPEFSLTGAAPWNPWPGLYGFGTIEAGGSRQITIRGILDPAVTGNISNTAFVTSTTYDPDKSNNSVTINTSTAPDYNVTVTKAADPSPVIAGNTINYTVTIKTTGTSNTPSLTFNDIIPADIQNAKYSTDGGITWINVNNITNTIQLTLGILIPNSILNILITGTVNPATTNPSITNTAVVSDGTTTFEGPNTVVVNTSADMAVVKTIESQNATIIIYKIVTTNYGLSNALNVTLTDTVSTGITPGSLEYSFNNSAPWTPWVAAGYSFANPFTAGQSQTIYIRGTIDGSSAAITNTAVVNSATSDSNASNNTSSIISTQPKTTLGVVKTGPAMIVAGNNIQYSIQITNTGANPAEDVTITENFPPILTNYEWSLNSTNWNVFSGTLNIGTVTTTTTIYVRAQVPASAAKGNILTNEVIVDATNVDNPVSDTVDTTIDTSADISIIKAIDNPATATAGAVINYTLTIENAGPSVAKSINLYDSASPSSYVTLTEISTDGINWSDFSAPYPIGDLGVNSTLVLRLRQTVSSSAVNSFTNTALVLSQTEDPVQSNNTSKINVQVITSGDLRIAKILYNQTQVIAGSKVVYQIKVTNDGPSDAQSVMISDTITPTIDNIEYALNPAGPWYQWTGSYLNGTLKVKQELIIYIRGDVDASLTGSLTDYAVVSSTTPDPNKEDNDVELSSNIVRIADIGVTKETVSSQIVAGQKVTFKKVITNYGPSDTTGIVLNDILPSNIESQKFLVEGSSTWNDWTGSYTIPILKAGESVEILIEGIITSTTTVPVTNTATVNGNDTDPYLDNNTSLITTPVNTSADLSIQKTSVPNTANPGEYLYYTLVVNNIGPSSAVNAVVKDDIDSGILTDIEYSVDGGVTWNLWNGSRSLSIAVSGLVRTILIRGIVVQNLTNPITNVATISSDTPDPVMSNNTDSIITEVATTTSADVSVVKTGLTNNVILGSLMNYVIVVSNNGPDTAEGVVLSDTASSGLTQVEYSIDDGTTWSAWGGSYSIGSLDSGSSVTVLLRGTTNSTSTGYIINTATVTATTTDPNTDNNVSIVVTEINGFAQLTIKKTGCPDTVCIGDQICYTIVIENNGPSSALNVVLIDIIPNYIINPKFSVDGGITWSNWFSTYNLGTVTSNSSVTILINGIVGPGCHTECICNTAQVISTTINPCVLSTISTSTICVSSPPVPCGKFKKLN